VELILFLIVASAPYMLVAFIIFLIVLIPAVHARRRKPEKKEAVAGRIIAWQVTVGLSVFAFCTYVVPGWDINSPWVAVCSLTGLVCAGIAGWHAGSRRWGRLAAAVAGVVIAAVNFGMDVGNALG
jgi:hypothetical protein